ALSSRRGTGAGEATPPRAPDEAPEFHGRWPCLSVRVTVIVVPISIASSARTRRVMRGWPAWKCDSCPCPEDTSASFELRAPAASSASLTEQSFLIIPASQPFLQG